jgi:hypothetical protein
MRHISTLYLVPLVFILAGCFVDHCEVRGFDTSVDEAPDASVDDAIDARQPEPR